MNDFGLSSRHMEIIREGVTRFADIEKMVVFGSRAMGNFKPGSDVDLALVGNLAPNTVSRLSYLLNEETTLPYKFDLVEYSTISEPALKAHIDTEGKVLFEQS